MNQDHPWSHNDAYAPFVIHHARRARRAGAARALDVGCGTGGLLRRLAHVLPDVTGMEDDPAIAATATNATSDHRNVTVEATSFPARGMHRYDFISMVAVLHHLPLEVGVRAARDALAPGGRLVVVGCYREDSRVDLWLATVSALLNPVIGVLVHPRRAPHPPVQMTAPVVEAADSYAAIRRALQGALPGVRIRRGLFWRYAAVWIAPSA